MNVSSVRERAIDTAVVLAGGEGRRTRLKKKHQELLKVMFPVQGKPNLARNLEILRDQLAVRNVILILNYRAQEIREYFGTGSEYGLMISYARSEGNDGIADALYRVREEVPEWFYVMLGDEFYLNTSHHSLGDVALSHDSSVVCYMETNTPQKISENYSITLTHDGLIEEVVEKPTVIKNNYLGLGTFLFQRTIFDAIEKVSKNPITNRRELVDAVGELSKISTVQAQKLSGTYLNLNTADDCYLAQYLANTEHFQRSKKSLVIPTYNEADSVGFVIDDFFDYVDEIVVADGGSTDGTIAEVRRHMERGKINLLEGSFAGYGEAIKRGIENATGELVVVTEADATFRARDISKLYEYVKDCDMVVGTRTTKQFICQGANMPFLLRLGNVLAAKFIEVLWITREPHFTDVGCTFRAFWRSGYNGVKKKLTGVGPEFAPEMVVEYLQANKRIIEVPVSYYGRVGGQSKHSAGWRGVSKTAWRMLVMVLRKRLSFEARATCKDGE